MALHLIERYRFQTSRFAERDICGISTSYRPMMVGAEVDIIILLFLYFTVSIYWFYLVGQILVYKFDVFLFTGGNSLIFFRQIELDGGRCNQVVHLHPFQIVSIGVDHLGIALGQGLAGAENLHSHILI